MTIMKYTTAYPFRESGGAMLCVYCAYTAQDPADHRAHMQKDHETFDVEVAFGHNGFKSNLKVDCTDLRCRVCSQTFDQLSDIATHLKEIHEKLIYPGDLGLQLFKFEPGKWMCACCSEKFTCLRVLSMHTATHYRRLMCFVCAKTYSSEKTLDWHILKHHTNVIACDKCHAEFETKEERFEHLQASIRCRKYICPSCPERFRNSKEKKKHLETVHGRVKPVLSCTECSMQFKNQNRYSYHFIKEHTDRYACNVCGQKYDNPRRLEEHVATHTGSKVYECDVCHKRFGRKGSLRTHYMQHQEVKKWKCDVCDKQFNQKVSWRSHMSTKHQNGEDNPLSSA